jgi:hypothetical protein
MSPSEALAEGMDDVHELQERSSLPLRNPMNRESEYAEGTV